VLVVVTIVLVRYISLDTDATVARHLQAAEKDRAWDDWKDNNPRGWGNKMGKRF
jgi:hypothetical protein